MCWLFDKCQLRFARRSSVLRSSSVLYGSLSAFTFPVKEISLFLRDFSRSTSLNFLTRSVISLINIYFLSLCLVLLFACREREKDEDLRLFSVHRRHCAVHFSMMVDGSELINADLMQRTDHIKSLCHEAETVGIETVMTLADQGEQLKTINSHLSTIDTTLVDTHQHINRLKGMTQRFIDTVRLKLDRKLRWKGTKEISKFISRRRPVSFLSQEEEEEEEESLRLDWSAFEASWTSTSSSSFSDGWNLQRHGMCSSSIERSRSRYQRPIGRTSRNNGRDSSTHDHLHASHRRTERRDQQNHLNDLLSIE